jgi:hypothetical protein
LIKEITISEAFQEALQVEQDLLNGIDTDKVCPYIEDFICKQEPLTKVTEVAVGYICHFPLFYIYNYHRFFA